MSQFVDTNEKAFTAGAAISQYLRVKLSSGKLAVAANGATDGAVELGTVTRDTFADGDRVAVRLRNARGTTKMVAGAAIAAGVAVYGAASGKISSSASGSQIGISMEAAAADGDIIEVMRI